MFPIPWNFPFRKKNGDITTIDEMVESSGGGLPPHTVDDAGKVLGVDDEGLLKWGSELPPHTTDDAGKVLGVDDEGLLEWGELPTGAKVYYKDYTMSVQSVKELASFSSDTASGSGLYIAAPYNAPNINISGYRAILVSAIDVYTGYQCSVNYNVWNDNTLHVATIFNSRNDFSGVKYRVYYVKNENIEQLT